MRPIIVRGSGDLATGTIWALAKAGYSQVVLETERPMAIRRQAAFCEAVLYGEKTVEGITARRASDAEDALVQAVPGAVPVLVDPEAEILKHYRPPVLIDAILAKKNLGTTMDMADYTIAIGPGFCAGRDVHAVIESMRGHDLGRIITKGEAIPNTGVPGIVGGYDRERVIHAPAAGILHNRRKISDLVQKDEVLAEIETGGSNGGIVPVHATLTGVLRGILPDGFPVWEGLKMADIDPRKDEVKNCFTISDKARCIAGSVLLLVSAFEKGMPYGSGTLL